MKTYALKKQIYVLKFPDLKKNGGNFVFFFPRILKVIQSEG